MRKLTCMIIDDEPLAVQLLKSYVEKTESLDLKGAFTSSVKALNALHESPVDIVFLDIQMPGMDGLELSHSLPAGTKVIFTTAFKDYAVDSYEVAAIDYLVKPIRYPKFFAAVEKAVDWFRMSDAAAANSPSASPAARQTANSTTASLFVRADNSFVRVDFSDILYIQGMKDYVRIFLMSRKTAVTTHLTMKAIEEKLPADKFIRISRSVIVAKEKIRSIDYNNCVYIGDEIFHIGDTYRDKVMKEVMGS